MVCNCKKPKNLDCPEQFRIAVEGGYRRCIYNENYNMDKKDKKMKKKYKNAKR